MRRSHKISICGLASVVILAAAVLGVVVAARWLRTFAVNNPMLGAFLASFDLVNDSGAAIDVIVIGMREGSGLYGPLPQYRDATAPYVRLPADRVVSLPPGARATITYDCDDFNFRHLIVRTNDGGLYLLDTDKRGTRHSCYGPQQPEYRIPAVNSLSVAPAELQSCVSGKYVSYSGAVEYPE